MGKQYPCIAWVLILWDKFRDLLSTKHKGKDCVQAIEEEEGPIPAVDIITNTLPRLPAKDYCAHPLSKVYGSVPATKKIRPIPDLPSDIITNILTRLPAKSIFQLWQQTNPNGLLYHLTTDRHFIRTHLDQRPPTPTIVARSRLQSVDNNIKLFFFDGSSSNGYRENIEATSLDLSSWNCKTAIFLCGSYDGFLLFNTMWDPAIFCIWNPITKEQVIVTSPPCPIPGRTPTGWPGPHNRETWVCGFYFHPLKKEYEVICVRMLAGAKIWVYQILNLRTKLRRSVGSCSYPPSRKRWPILVNRTFYWMVDCTVYVAESGIFPSLSNSILTFNLETEEFSTMEFIRPSYDAHLNRRYNRFQLIDLDGELGLFDPWSSSSLPKVAVIWVFNCSTKCWDKNTQSRLLITGGISVKLTTSNIQENSLHILA